MKRHRLWITLILALGLSAIFLLIVDGFLTTSPPVSAAFGDAPLGFGPSFKVMNSHGLRSGPTTHGDVDLEFISYLGGSNNGIAVQGDYAYTGFGRAFIVLDVSNPASPMQIGSMPGSITDIKVAGDYAYVIAGGVGLVVVDISDPFDPRLVGTCELPLSEGYPLSVAISGTLAYVGQGDTVRVVDVFTPTQPVELGAVEVEGMSARDVVVAGRYVYVAGRDAGLRVIDVFTPTAPNEVGACTTDIGYATGVDIVGDMVYVSDAAIGDSYSTAMLRVVNVSTPSSPVVIGSEEVFRGANADAFGVQVIGDHAYVAGFAYIAPTNYGGLQVVDISNPTEPDRVTDYVTPDVASAYDLVVVGEHAFLTTQYSGKLLIVNVSDLSAQGLYEVGRFEVPEAPTDVAAVGNYLYLFDWGLTVVDASQPEIPRMVGEFEVAPPILAKGHVHVRGDYAYLANAAADFNIVDISDPADPQGVGSCDAHGRDLALRGNYAYLPNQDLNIVDITNSNAPALVGTIPISGYAQRMDIADDHGYVLTDGSLQVLDLTNPTAPQKIGSRDLPDLSTDIAVSGDYVYVVAYDEQLRIIDVSDPSAPATPITCTLTGDAKHITIEGNYAYVATEYMEWVDATLYQYTVLSMVDISDPTSAREVATYKVTDNSGGVACGSGNYAYLLSGAGLYTLRIVPLALEVTPASISVMTEAGTVGDRPELKHTLQVARASRPLTWTATVSPTVATWLSVYPLTGSTPATITVGISVTGLLTSASPYEAQIIVASEEPVEGSPQVTDVTLIVAKEISRLYLPVVRQAGR